jgi:hypothetical protein
MDHAPKKMDITAKEMEYAELASSLSRCNTHIWKEK